MMELEINFINFYNINSIIIHVIIRRHTLKKNKVKY